MKTILFGMAVAFHLLLTHSARGQRSGAGLPLRISLFNETATLPSVSRLTARLNPGLSVGTELYYRQSKKHQWLQTLNLGGFYHKELATSLLITSEVGYRFFARKVHIDLKAGPGYLLNKSAAPLYRYNGEEYSKTSGIQHRVIATAGLSLGMEAGPVTPFVAYNVMIEAPFLQNNSVFLPHQLFQLGVARKIRRSIAR